MRQLVDQADHELRDVDTSRADLGSTEKLRRLSVANDLLLSALDAGQRLERCLPRSAALGTILTKISWETGSRRLVALRDELRGDFHAVGELLDRGELEPAEARLETADAVVSAVPAHALRGLLPEEWRSRPPFAALARFGGSPIVSVEMWLDRVVVDRPMLGLRACEVEWVFDKGRLYGREGAPQHLAFIVSSAYRSASKANAELVAAAEGALRRYFPAMVGARVERALVLRDPLATFASTPELEALRPGPDTPLAGLFLAGDWTDTGLPATIEGAVRSGLRAAQHARAFGMGLSSRGTTV